MHQTVMKTPLTMTKNKMTMQRTGKRRTMMNIRAVMLAWEKMKVPLKKAVKKKMKKTHMQGSLVRRKAVLRSPMLEISK